MRAVDHCVLPTADLATARKRLSALGFTVAADARHPFGTGNCCVFLADGTYLEPLAVHDSGKVDLSATRGNVFTARDRAFRYRMGQEGFSALVFATDDARRDHRDFVRAGVSAGRTLAFSRPFVDPAGRRDTASFRLAFAADLRAPDAFFFTCQRLNAPAVDRSALQRHANGVTGIRAIVMEVPEPSSFQAFLETITGVSPVERNGSLSFRTANAEILIRPVPGKGPPREGLRLREIVFGCASLRNAANVLEGNGVYHRSAGERLVVASASGQGAAFAFEEPAAG